MPDHMRESETQEEECTYLIPYKEYVWLKWIGLIVCPALATFLGVAGPAWGAPNIESVVTTINAFGLFIGAILGYSYKTAEEG